MLAHRLVFTMYSSLPHPIYSGNTDTLWGAAALLSPGSVLEGNGERWAWPNSSHPTSLLSLWGSGTQPQCTSCPKLGITDTRMPWAPSNLALRNNCGGRKSLANLAKCWGAAFQGDQVKTPVFSLLAEVHHHQSHTTTPVTWVQWTTRKLLKASFGFVWQNGYGEQIVNFSF